MDGAYSVLGRQILYNNHDNYVYVIINPDEEILCGQMHLECALQVCPPQSTQGQITWEEMSSWISVLCT